MIPSEPLANAPVLGGMDFSAAGRLAQLSVERLEAYRYWDVAVGLRGGVHRDKDDARLALSSEHSRKAPRHNARQRLGVTCGKFDVPPRPRWPGQR